MTGQRRRRRRTATTITMIIIMIVIIIVIIIMIIIIIIIILVLLLLIIIINNEIVKRDRNSYVRGSRGLVLLVEETYWLGNNSSLKRRVFSVRRINFFIPKNDLQASTNSLLTLRSCKVVMLVLWLMHPLSLIILIFILCPWTKLDDCRKWLLNNGCPVVY